jgi:hypothetical protein
MLLPILMLVPKRLKRSEDVFSSGPFFLLGRRMGVVASDFSTLTGLSPRALIGVASLECLLEASLTEPAFSLMDAESVERPNKRRRFDFALSFVDSLCKGT